MSMTIKHAAAVVATSLLTVILAMDDGFAQQAPPAAPSPAAQPGSAARPPAAATPHELDVSALRDFIAEQRRRIEELQGRATERLKDAQQAGPQFDALIEEYQLVVKKVGSGSEFIGVIDRVVLEYEGFAREAAASSSASRRARVEDFRAVAAQARRDKETLIAQANHALAQIERLRLLKDDAVDLYRLGRGAEILKSIREQIDAISTVNNRMTDAANSLEATRSPRPQQ